MILNVKKIHNSKIRSYVKIILCVRDYNYLYDHIELFFTYFYIYFYIKILISFNVFMRFTHI